MLIKKLYCGRAIPLEKLYDSEKKQGMFVTHVQIHASAKAFSLNLFLNEVSRRLLCVCNCRFS